MSTRRKRPPSNRKATATADAKPSSPSATVEKIVEEDPLTSSSDPFGFDEVVKKPTESSTDQQAPEPSKLTEASSEVVEAKVTAPKKSLFDTEDSDDLDIFKPKSNKAPFLC